MRITIVWLLLCFRRVGAGYCHHRHRHHAHHAAQTPDFSGFNDEVVFPAEYFDYRLNNLAAQLSPGWVRYPSGLFSNAFNWRTGLMKSLVGEPF